MTSGMSIEVGKLGLAPSPSLSHDRKGPTVSLLTFDMPVRIPESMPEVSEETSVEKRGATRHVARPGDVSRPVPEDQSTSAPPLVIRSSGKDVFSDAVASHG
jgi:hypothetical protein